MGRGSCPQPRARPWAPQGQARGSQAGVSESRQRGQTLRLCLFRVTLFLLFFKEQLLVMSNFVTAISAKRKSDPENIPSRYRGRLPTLLDDTGLLHFAG